MTPEHAQVEGQRLIAAVQAHKSAIGRHRRQLHTVKTQLEQLRSDCARLGIRLELVTPGEGSSSHGHADRTA